MRTLLCKCCTANIITINLDAGHECDKHEKCNACVYCSTAPYMFVLVTKKSSSKTHTDGLVAAFGFVVIMSHCLALHDNFTTCTTNLHPALVYFHTPADEIVACCPHMFLLISSTI